MSNVNVGLAQELKHSVPVDSFRNQILAARTVMTRNVTLTGGATKDEIQVPKGCYEVGIKSSSAVTFYETANTYTQFDKKQDGSLVENTYGSGYSGTNMSMPVYNGRFWLNGTGTVTLLFSSIREV